MEVKGIINMSQEELELLKNTVAKSLFAAKVNLDRERACESTVDGIQIAEEHFSIVKGIYDKLGGTAVHLSDAEWEELRVIFKYAIHQLEQKIYWTGREDGDTFDAVADLEDERDGINELFKKIDLEGYLQFHGLTMAQWQRLNEEA